MRRRLAEAVALAEKAVAERAQATNTGYKAACDPVIELFQQRKLEVEDAATKAEATSATSASVADSATAEVAALPLPPADMIGKTLGFTYDATVWLGEIASYAPRKKMFTVDFKDGPADWELKDSSARGFRVTPLIARTASAPTQCEPGQTSRPP